jgi:hypothetical protein
MRLLKDVLKRVGYDPERPELLRLKVPRTLAEVETFRAGLQDIPYDEDSDVRILLSTLICKWTCLEYVSCADWQVRRELRYSSPCPISGSPSSLWASRYWEKSESSKSRARISSLSLHSVYPMSRSDICCATMPNHWLARGVVPNTPVRPLWASQLRYMYALLTRHTYTYTHNIVLVASARGAGYHGLGLQHHIRPWQLRDGGV